MKYKITVMSPSEWKKKVHAAFAAAYADDPDGELYAAVNAAILAESYGGFDVDTTSDGVDRVATAIVLEGMVALVIPCDVGDARPVLYCESNSERRSKLQAMKAKIAAIEVAREIISSVHEDALEGRATRKAARTSVNKFSVRDVESWSALRHAFDAVNRQSGGLGGEGESLSKSRLDTPRCAEVSAKELISMIRDHYGI